ncbi:PQQ-binding-like beta-propeller repeat protein [Rhizohabitans arisaemae]|uniref:outer membrane protein assembly factor BamB family protein n=1 Tax=Rhizohabitans arisaemae TaxID=2720610 RepID=UPI0024B27EA7|nr:PQQ-binding-like beta-propeller repeat protein [Rhizohabitans arisaemae]
MRVFEPLQESDPQQVGHYRILARLGSGGMGVVYLGRSRAGRAVAVKVVNAALAGDPEFRLRFAREVALARTVSGFFTAGVIDADMEGSPPWLATAYVAGLSLEEIIEEYGPWPETSVRTLGAGLAEALESIHTAGVVHRDLKPANVLLAPDGPRVIDFGISLAVGGARLTRTDALIGTPGFMSPEQVVGDPVGPPGDVFCLGAVLVYAATGTGPFGTGSAQSLWYRIANLEPTLDALPAGLRAVVAQCLDKRPERRPTTEALLGELAGPDTARGSVTELFADTAWLPENVVDALRAGTARPLPATPAPTPSVPGDDPVRPAAATVPRAEAEPTRARVGPKPPGSPADTDPEAVPEPGEPPRNPVSEVTTDSSGAEPQDTGASAVPRPAAPDSQDTRPPEKAPFATESSGLRTPPTQPRSGEAGDGEDPGDAVTSRRRGVSRRQALIALRVLGVATLGFAGWRLFGDGDGDGDDDGRGERSGGPVGSPSPLPSTPGSLRWSFTTGEFVSSSPAVVGGVVYCGSGDNKLYAIDAATGRRLWEFTTRDKVFSSPAVADGIVYVGSGDRNLYAIEAATGRQRWAFTTGGWVRSSPAVDDGTVYIGSGDKNLHAVDLVTGRQRWRYSTGAEVNSSPAVADGTVYVGDDDGRLHAVDAATGRRRWTFTTTPRRVRSTPAVEDGTVYVSSYDKHLYAVDAATGKQRWTFPTGGRVPSSPKVVDGVVYLGSIDRNVYAIDAATGNRRWAFTAGAELYSSPAIADGVLYIGDYAGRFYAIDLAAGRERWTYATGDKITSDPVVGIAEGTVYLSSYDTKIYALHV